MQWILWICVKCQCVSSNIRERKSAHFICKYIVNLLQIKEDETKDDAKILCIKEHDSLYLKHYISL